MASTTPAYAAMVSKEDKTESRFKDCLEINLQATLLRVLLVVEEEVLLMMALIYKKI